MRGISMKDCTKRKRELQELASNRLSSSERQTRENSDQENKETESVTKSDPIQEAERPEKYMGRINIEDEAKTSQ